MKKITKITLVIIMTIIFTGCSMKKEVVTKCSNTSSQNKYEVTSNYNIYSKNDIVNKVVLEEVVKSSDQTTLSTMEKSYKNMYKAYNKSYGGYTYKVDNDGKTVKLTLTIDYQNIDMNKYIKDNVSFKDYLNDNNELTLEGIKNMYKFIGVKCK